MSGKISEVDDDFTENIVDVDVVQEMESSFLEYAYSVIYSRALPDARDGMKPVQRRILYMMADMGLRPDRGHVKCSRVVGEVMGKLHPHGDTAIYDALVRLAQPFALRLPLVDGHGNFGSLDDGPAAPRYTEARLGSSALAMTADIGEDVVDFVPNYDNKLMQPEVLPAAIPNLLVNGASGIAVGMATNLAPHNLVEVIAGAKALLANRDISLEDLMKIIPGPDLPSGGSVIGLEGIRDAAATGRGTFKTRGVVQIENVTARRKGIVVTELPYMVGPEKLIEKIKDAVTAKKLTGISAVADLTDRSHGLRIVIEVKTGFNPEAVLEALYKTTPLEDSFGINNVALVEGQPQTMGLKPMLSVWVDHRLDVVRRRSEFRLMKREERKHLVEGLLLAIVDIDRVISIVRAADDAEAAKSELISAFSLSPEQAEYILELRLRRLTKFSALELDKENQQLADEIAGLKEILVNPSRLSEVVAAEMDEVAALYGTPRRTMLFETDGTPVTSSAGKPVSPRKAVHRVTAGPASLEVADDPCLVVLSVDGVLMRTEGVEPLGVGNSAIISAHVPATGRGDVGVVTSKGRLLRTSVMELLTYTGTLDGPNASELVTLQDGETVVGLASLTPDSPSLTLGTRRGVVKRVTAGDHAKADEWQVISLKDDDEVVNVSTSSDGDQLVFVSSDGSLLHFPAASVRPQGRAAGGMAGIKLSNDAHVVFFGVVNPDIDNVVATIAGSTSTLDGIEPGSAKVSPFDVFPAKGRATGGVRAQRFLKGEDALLKAFVGLAPLKALSENMTPVSLPDMDQRRDGSGAPLSAAVRWLG